MRHTPVRILMLALLALGLMTAGCAKKKPAQSPPTPPAEQPTTPTPTPVPDTTSPPPVPLAASFSELGVVYFALDSYSLDDAGRAVLDKNAKLMRDNPDWTATVAGHCDERGTVEYNQALGEKRANAVRDYLVAAGVPVARLKTVSYGKEMPAVEGHDEASWARNRRAEFTR
jgi:peptidoglycan-associated lipoprotein